MAGWPPLGPHDRVGAGRRRPPRPGAVRYRRGGRRIRAARSAATGPEAQPQRPDERRAGPARAVERGGDGFYAGPRLLVAVARPGCCARRDGRAGAPRRRRGTVARPRRRRAAALA